MEDFLARTSALQDLEKDWKESEADYFLRSSGSVAKYDPLSSSWRTSQLSLLEGACEWSEKLPRWGMTVDGALYPLRRLGRRISGKDGFFWPTPKASEGKRGGLKSNLKRDNPGLSYMIAPPEILKNGKKLCPKWTECLMGYPIGHTELAPWATLWFRSKRNKRLKY